MKPSLAERLRAVVGGAVPRVHPDAGPGPGVPPAQDRASTSAAPPPSAGRIGRAQAAAAVLGGVVEERNDGACIVVERRYDAAAKHGLVPIGDIVETLREARDGMATLHRAWPARGASLRPGPPPPLDGLTVIDLETTGLTGGAGTQAFLVGCARVDGGGVTIRQFLSPGFEHERAQLATVAEWLHDCPHLLTFNGRTFDLPLLEMRFAFHRLAWPWAEVPHLDALHPARRFWRDRPELTGPDPDDMSCSLSVLEKRLSGVHRVGDVPGFEIPARYFQFARDGQPAPLEAVLEHNRLDLLSTLLVCARAASLVVRGPDAAAHGHECLGLGRLYDRVGQPQEAEACYARAAAAGGATRDGRLRGEALRRLALIQRRARRFDQAAESWRALLATRGVSALLRREAREALAIHHEHRARDLGLARGLVLDALAEPLTHGRRSDAERRLARLERKLDRLRGRTRFPGLDDPSMPALSFGCHTEEA